MDFLEGTPICWLSQATAGVAPVRKSGRITQISRGSAHIRIFDDEVKAWICLRVKPISLRRIKESALAELEELERKYPVVRIDANPFNGAAPALTQSPGAPKPADRESLVRMEVQVRRKDADLVLEVTRALADPSEADAVRALLRTHFGTNSDLFAQLKETPAPGRLHSPHPDLDVRVAYRVLVMRDKCATLARKLGISSPMVRARVRRGVECALSHAADPALKPFGFESIPMLRRRALALQPALERVFLYISKQKPKKTSEEMTDQERCMGRSLRDLPPEFDVRLAYRVLIGNEDCEVVGQALGVSGQRVRQRVENGVKLALDHAADPQLERLRSVTLSGLR